MKIVVTKELVSRNVQGLLILFLRYGNNTIGGGNGSGWNGWFPF